MSGNGDLRASFIACEEVSPLCPVEATVLGYTPNLGANVFFAVAFGIALFATIGIGVWKKTWTFTAAVALGAGLETMGYAGRAAMSKNPWNKDAFQMQICVIILGPTVICAGIYLIIKHIALNVDPSLSRVRPKWYPLFFLPADVSCLLIQAIGGSLAAAAGSTNQKLLDGGNRAIIAGICLQVVVLSLFGLVSGEYLLRVRRKIKSLGREEAERLGMGLWFEKRFRTFLRASSAAYLAILCRCIYRIAEMAGGWGNHIMQDEISFVILDSCLCLVAVWLLTIFAPGLYFPQMATNLAKKKQESDSEKNTTAVDGVLSEGAATE